MTISLKNTRFFAVLFALIMIATFIYLHLTQYKCANGKTFYVSFGGFQECRELQRSKP